MNRRRFYRVLFVLLALAFLLVSISLAFALAAHAGCRGNDCVPCLSLAKAQEVLRQFGGGLAAVLGALALLVLLQLILAEYLGRRGAFNLVGLKMRLNN